MDQIQNYYSGLIRQNAMNLGGAPITDDRQIRVGTLEDRSKMSLNNINFERNRVNYLDSQQAKGQDAVTYDVYINVAKEQVDRKLKQIGDLDHLTDGSEQKTVQLGPDTFVVVTRNPHPIF